jgi:eukaryotic-like serine/threonine-protein kinase
VPTATTREPSTQPERRIGPYRVIRELGHGGMGTVYLAARDDDQYQKRVAIKVVRGLDSAEVVRHFRRERQILAGLEHPNVARLLDGGTTEDGLPYLVMQHVEGQPIDRFCDERKLTVRERLELFQGVCAAVQHAHRNLLVHRDIKPATSW